MKIMTKVLIAAAAALMVAGMTSPAEAACGSFATLGTNAGPAGASFVWNDVYWTPQYYTGLPPYQYPVAIPPITPAAEGIFWALGTGDPIPGLGDDSNAWPATVGGWLYYYNYGGTYILAAEVFTGWGQAAAIDGCISNNPGRCTCMLLTDQTDVGNPATNDGQLALMSGQADPTLTTFFNQPGNDGAGNAGPIKVASIPKPLITNSVRNGTTFDLDLVEATVATPPGLYFKDGCDCIGDGGFQVYYTQLPRSSAAPSDRDASLWTLAPGVGGGAQGVTPFGGTAQLSFPCGASDVDIWLAARPVFDNIGASVWPTNVVSGNSTRIECGPNLAEPDDVRPVRPGREDRVRGMKRNTR